MITANTNHKRDFSRTGHPTPHPLQRKYITLYFELYTEFRRSNKIIHDSENPTFQMSAFWWFIQPVTEQITLVTTNTGPD